LSKLHVNGESPIFVQYSAWNREKCENLKKSQIQSKYRNFEKQYFKIFTYEDVWQFLTPNILTLCSDDLLSDGPPVIEEVFSLWNGAVLCVCELNGCW
jgi:hypothetical protein